MKPEGVTNSWITSVYAEKKKKLSLSGDVEKCWAWSFDEYCFGGIA